MKMGYWQKKITRREFGKIILSGAIYSGLAALGLKISGCTRGKASVKIPGREAKYYHQLKDKIVQCTLCPNTCVIANWERAPCLVRENRDGKLFTLAHSNPCAVHVDPIEKKPLFHVLPGSTAFSLATAGCNFHCKNCQNWQISQYPPEETENLDFPPKRIVEEALARGSPIIAYTYSEPVIFYEYMFETAQLANQKGLINIFHSNGYIKKKPLKKLCCYLQAANIDLKGITPQFYDEVCFGELKPVQDALITLKEEGTHVEITNLIIPTLNDSESQIKKLCSWVYQNLGSEIPLHFSRFYPEYRLKNLPLTPLETLEKARNIALEKGHKFVYIGNVPGHEGENTYCPNCQKTLIKRFGYQILENNLIKGKCKFCGQIIPGIWKT